MAEFIKNNKFLVHVAAEISFVCILVIYIYKNNRNTYSHIQYLEQKLYAYESILEKHEQLLNTLLSKKVSFKEPLKISKSDYSPTSPTPPSSPLSPPTPPSSPSLSPSSSLSFSNKIRSIDDNDVKIVENDEVNDEIMDNEINEELNKLNLLK